MYKREAYVLTESFHRVALDIIPGDWLDNEEDDGHWFVPSVVNMALLIISFLVFCGGWVFLHREAAPPNRLSKTGFIILGVKSEQW